MQMQGLCCLSFVDVVRVARIVCRWATGGGDVVTGRLWGEVSVRVVEESSDRWQAGMSAAVDVAQRCPSAVFETRCVGCWTAWMARNAFRVSPLAVVEGSSAEVERNVWERSMVAVKVVV
jgi:hypothetical protein